MTTEQLRAEIDYHASLAPFKSLLESGVITEEDHAAAASILYKECRPVFVEIMPEKQVDISPEQR